MAPHATDDQAARTRTLLAKLEDELGGCFEAYGAWVVEGDPLWREIARGREESVRLGLEMARTLDPGASEPVAILEQLLDMVVEDATRQRHG